MLKKILFLALLPILAFGQSSAINPALLNLAGGGPGAYYNTGSGTSGACNPIANPGSGGGGAGSDTAGDGSGGGGQAGGYIEAQINNPSSSYTYALGAAGSGGSGAGSGCAGAAGQIIVDEYYQ